MPVLIEFLGVEMRGEVSPIGGGTGYMMEGRGVGRRDDGFQD